MPKPARPTKRQAGVFACTVIARKGVMHPACQNKLAQGGRSPKWCFLRGLHSIVWHCVRRGLHNANRRARSSAQSTCGDCTAGSGANLKLAHSMCRGQTAEMFRLPSCKSFSEAASPSVAITRLQVSTSRRNLKNRPQLAAARRVGAQAGWRVRIQKVASGAAVRPGAEGVCVLLYSSSGRRLDRSCSGEDKPGVRRGDDLTPGRAASRH